MIYFFLIKQSREEQTIMHEVIDTDKRHVLTT